MQYYVAPGGRKQDYRSLPDVGRAFGVEADLSRTGSPVHDYESVSSLGRVWYPSQPDLCADYVGGPQANRAFIVQEDGQMRFVSGTKFEVMAGRATVRKYHSTLMFRSLEEGSQAVKFIQQFPNCANVGSRKRCLESRNSLLL